MLKVTKNSAILLSDSVNHVLSSSIIGWGKYDDITKEVLTFSSGFAIKELAKAAILDFLALSFSCLLTYSSTFVRVGNSSGFSGGSVSTLSSKISDSSTTVAYSKHSA